MKITCNQKDLARGLSIANRAVASRSTIPMYTYLRLESSYDNTGELRITGTDGNLRIESTVSCDVGILGQLAVPARLFVDLISRLTGTVTLDVNYRTMTVDVLCGNYKAKINGLNGEDYPTMQHDKAVASMQIPAPLLCQTIDAVAFAASTDMARQNLTGVNVSIDGERFSMAATDGVRLSRCSNTIDMSPNHNHSIIVPATGLREISQSLAGDTSDIWVYIYERRFMVESDGVNVAQQLIDGRYPDYMAIMPNSHTTHVTVDTKALLRSLQVARLLTNTEKDGIQKAKFSINAATNQLSIYVRNSETGDSGDALDAQIDGKSLEIILSIGYVVDALSHVDDESVMLCFSGNNKPCVIRKVDAPEDDLVHVVMPVVFSMFDGGQP